MSKRKGFTIIEVVLVLAIAGLIFLMVFLGLPALQRAQRNTERKADLNRFLSAFEEFRKRNGATNPYALREIPAWDGGGSTWELSSGFVNRYIDDGMNDDNETCDSEEGCKYFTDPNGSLYRFRIKAVDYSASEELNVLSDSSAQADGENVVNIYVQSKCGDNEETVQHSAGDGNYALVYLAENNAVLCASNN